MCPLPMAVLAAAAKVVAANYSASSHGCGHTKARHNPRTASLAVRAMPTTPSLYPPTSGDLIIASAFSIQYMILLFNFNGGF